MNDSDEARMKSDAIERIAQCVREYGRFIYNVVSDDQLPPWYYTIGCAENCDFELVAAGMAEFDTGTVAKLLNVIADRGGELVDKANFQIDGLGIFHLRKIHRSWLELMTFGANDYYGRDDLQFLQIVPDGSQYTRDVPNMSYPYSSRLEPCWRWLVEPWEYSVPQDSSCVTDLSALKDSLVTHCARWETNEWQLTTGPSNSIPEIEFRSAKLGTMLSIDPTLEALTELEVGQSVFRSFKNDAWKTWE